MKPGIIVDDTAIRRTFQRYPEASARRLNRLIEAGAIDTQAEMRRNVNVASGETRQRINYRTKPGEFAASIGPDLPEARVMSLERGSKPHWVSARPGSPLEKWAKGKGINVFAVQRSIAKKGTKPHPFIEPTYRTMRPRVIHDVLSGFAQFIREVDSRGLA